MKTIRGNLISLAKNGKFDLIVHGCNCFCTMGSGIAPKIAWAFRGPAGPSQVDDLTEIGDKNKLGTCSYAYYLHNDLTITKRTKEDTHPLPLYDGTRLIIANAYTQYGTAKAGECVVDYDAVRSCFKDISDRMRGEIRCWNEHLRIGYPAIGSGLAGGNWDKIYAIINEELDRLNHTFVEYNGV